MFLVCIYRIIVPNFIRETALLFLMPEMASITATSPIPEGDLWRARRRVVRRPDPRLAIAAASTIARGSEPSAAIATACSLFSNAVADPEGDLWHARRRVVRRPGASIVVVAAFTIARGAIGCGRHVPLIVLKRRRRSQKLSLIHI